LAMLQGADSWEVLTKRKPEESKKPLYTFHYDRHRGTFEWSDACVVLVEKMDSMWQNYEDIPQENQELAAELITNKVAKRPDFLEGCLALATIQKIEGRLEKARESYREGIKRAEALIPKEYKGPIDWLYTENRFYHRLLYNYMLWCAEYGKIVSAIKLARKQLRLNPGDNLGVHISLPIMLAADGQHASAERAMRRLLHPDHGRDGHVLLV